MVAFIHTGVDRVLLTLADRTSHSDLRWVDAPVVEVDVPMGGVLRDALRLGVVWPRHACILEVPSPVNYLGPPHDRLHLRFWPTKRPRRGVVVLVPPWKLISWSTLTLVVKGLGALGFDVVGYPTPFHFERTPPGTFSGEFFATWDMPRTGLAIRTAVMELCTVVESLQHHHGPVLLMGLSLGGYLGALMSVVAQLHPDRAFAPHGLCLVVPPESILDSFLKTRIGERYRELLIKAGGTVPDVEYLHGLSLPWSPSRFKSAVPGARILVAGARHDELVPIESTRKLAAALGARYLEYEAGHVTGMCSTFGVWRDVGKFLSQWPAVNAAPLPLGQVAGTAPPTVQGGGS